MLLPDDELVSELEGGTVFGLLTPFGFAGVTELLESSGELGLAALGLLASFAGVRSWLQAAHRDKAARTKQK